MAKRLFDAEKAKERISKNGRETWWRRKGSKSRGFKYYNRNNQRITDEKKIERVENLVIPPAWKYVRISPSPKSKLQAVGMDTSGRVQYLYSDAYRKKREREKFKKIERFGEHLPCLRAVTNEHIRLEGFPREKVLAVMTRLVNSLYMRIGSKKSVKKYRTYGITTLQKKHLEIKSGGRLIFSFVGKHRIKQRKVLADRELAGIMKELKNLGGRKLFEYLDENGKTRPVRARELNRYLKENTAPEFSAKDFRTWGGTLLAALELAEIGPPDDGKLLKKNVRRAVTKVADQLGNTPAVCRQSYIHPTVLKSYEKGITLECFTPKKNRRVKQIEAEYEPEEKALIKLFKSKK